MIRPTSGLVRNALFSIIEPYLDAPRVLDFFAGTGALGVEALRRGASWLEAVEGDVRRCVALRATLRTLGYGQRSHVHWSRVERAMAFLRGPYDLVLMDPPYGYEGTERLLQRIGASGEKKIVAPDGVVAVEHGRREAFPETVGALTFLTGRRYGDTGLTVYRRSAGPGTPPAVEREDSAAARESEQR